MKVGINKNRSGCSTNPLNCRSILPEGPVGKNGRLEAGDELLEVNGNKLLGLNHVEVVVILKELPLYVQMVCARPRLQDGRNPARNSVVFEEKDGDFLELKPQEIAREFIFRLIFK